MSLSKTELVLTITIFYAVLGVFMGFLGSLQLDEAPGIEYQNVLDKYDSNINGSVCSPLNEKGNYKILGNLFPVFLKPNCITATTEKAIYDYSEDKEAKKLNFLPNVIAGFSYVPVWLNVILLGPIAITLLFIIVTTIGGAIFDGGS